MRICPKCRTESDSDLPKCAVCGLDHSRLNLIEQARAHLVKGAVSRDEHFALVEAVAMKEDERGWSCPECGSSDCYAYLFLAAFLGVCVGIIIVSAILYFGGVR